MILVDTSVWVGFLRGQEGTAVDGLRGLITQDAEFALCDPVAMELLAGARTPRERSAAESIVDGVHTMATDAALDFRAGADLHRAARAAGHPIRSMLDCLIAAIAIRNDVPLLEHDRDYRYLAEVSTLRLHET